MAVPVVSELGACEPVPLAKGTAELRTTLDQARGCPRLVQQVLELQPDATLAGSAKGCGELWYVADGSGVLVHDGDEQMLSTGTGLFLRPGALEVRARGSGLQVVIVVLPAGADGAPDSPVSTRYEDCEPEITGDREFRVLIGPSQGCSAATQFVGDIPPGRAPVHEHTYDEVVLVLAGSGVVHLSGQERPLRRGTCVYLPPGSPHCLENTGIETFRVLGVFHPGGSPAAKKEHTR